MHIKEQVAVITGAGSGLGAATAEYLAQCGAKLALLDNNFEKVKKVAEKISALALSCNVTNEKSSKEAIDEIRAILGTPRILVNCAGVGTPSKVLTKEGPASLKEFQDIININLVGTFNLMRLCADLMAKLEVNDNGERGVIINTASIAAYEGQIGQVAYAASKGGIASLTLPAARELSRFGIRVVAVAPGLFGTPMLLSLPEQVQESLKEALLFPKRFGKPQEFAHLVASIIENPMINGETIRLDGGLRMQAR